MNLVLLQGDVTDDPTTRDTDDGCRIAFDLAAGDDPRPVPVTWVVRGRPPSLATGDTVTVIGSVRKHFYRSGGATVARCDVLAERVVKGRGRRAEAALTARLAELTL